MKLKHAKKNSGFTLVELLVVIAIIAGLAAISSPVIIRQIARSRATQAINNGKDIYVAIREHSFQRSTGVAPSGTDSDTTFRTELFALGFIEDEKPFFVKGVGNGATEADGDIGGTNAANALAEAADNVFAYCHNGTAGFNVVTAPANAPVLATPVVSGGASSLTNGTADTTWEFQNAAFGNQAVFVRSDGSTAAYGILTAGTLAGTDATDNMSDNTGTMLSVTIEETALNLTNS